MKITTLIMIIASMHIYANGYSQKISLVKKDEKLSKIFTSIQTQSGYTFFYKRSLIKDATASVAVNEVTVEEALNEVLKNKPLRYAIIDRTIVIQKDAKAPQISAPEQVTAPKVTISGVVQSSKGEALIGATVRVKGESGGVSTDVNGRFTLSADATAVLVVSYTGFEHKEVALNGRTSLTIVLNESLAQLNEVVVTALGISRDKKALAYALTEVKGDDFTQARENNLGTALSGRIAGVNASGSSTGPAGSSRVIIRGNGSLSGNNMPLYVINGIPMNNTSQGNAGTYGGTDRGDGLVSINPDDIETISVLKGGTAAALYGSRAANGVILITTKTGKAQQGIGVDYNSSYTLEEPLSTPDWQYEYGSGVRGQKATTREEARAYGRLSWGPKLDGSSVIQHDGVSRPYVAQQDNFKNFYNNGNTFSNTLSLNGGNETTNFRFSASNADNNGILENASFNRKTFNVSATTKLAKKIHFEAIAQYNIEEAKNRSYVADFTNNPNAALGVMATSLDVRTLAPGYDADGNETRWNDYSYVVNPYFAINKMRNGDERRRFIGSFNARYDLTDFLYARARVGIDHFTIDRFDITPTGTAYNYLGTMTEYDNKTYETNAELLIGAEKKFGRFSFNLIAGGNQMYTQTDAMGLSSGQFNVPFSYFIKNGKSQSFTPSFSATAINSVFGSADIGMNDYLYLTLTGRQDWFSTLSKNSNSLFYPSMGLSFVFSEAWTSKPSWLDFGKVRSSWAQVGGGAPSPYGLNIAYTAQSVSHLGQPLMNISSATIPNALKPYNSVTTEFGLDLKAFNNKVGVDITVYDRTSTDDIVSASVPTPSGYSSVSLNSGKMRNRGIELLLSFRPLKSSSRLTWDLSYNMAYNKNTVLRIGEGLTSLALPGALARTQNGFVYSYEGKPFGLISGYKIREDAQGNKVYNAATGLPLQSAFTDLGQGVPPLTMGVTNSFQYKNFNLSVLVDGKFGSSMYVSTDAYGTYYGLDKRTTAGGVRENGIAVSGVDATGKPFSKVVPAQDYYQGIAYSITDEFVSDAGFIKLRQLVLGYSVPRSLLGKAPIQSASVSLVARNLLLLYSQVKNVDPESNYSNTNAQGLENFGVPPTRSFGLNLMVKF
jgi:TonB-linked SusC/RagA family outer membrane protein